MLTGDSESRHGRIADGRLLNVETIARSEAEMAGKIIFSGQYAHRRWRHYVASSNAHLQPPEHGPLESTEIDVNRLVDFVLGRWSHPWRGNDLDETVTRAYPRAASRGRMADHR
jgi:hypothetical protein